MLENDRIEENARLAKWDAKCAQKRIFGKCVQNEVQKMVEMDVETEVDVEIEEEVIDEEETAREA